MKQIVTTAIVLSRTDYGEADRILTLLTPDQGKLRLLAKGVRRIKSKLAGGIELFSVSTITFIRGRGEIGTLVSARLEKHYGTIVQDLDRTMTGYKLIKFLNRQMEDEPEPEYFGLLEQIFQALNETTISLAVIEFWFFARLLALGGHAPNLQTTAAGQKLQPTEIYRFSVETMSFEPHVHGQFKADHIKFLRLAFAGNTPKTLQAVQASETLLAVCVPVTKTAGQFYLS